MWDPWDIWENIWKYGVELQDRWHTDHRLVVRVVSGHQMNQDIKNCPLVNVYSLL